MKVLTRYLLRSHIGPFFFAFVALTGVILINTLARQMASLAGKGLPTRVIAEFFMLSLPANIALTLPMSVLVAVLYTFSQMASEHEITALKASGIDLKRMVLPLLAVAALIAGAMVWFNDRVLPEANYRWRMLMIDVAQTTPLLALREQSINAIPTADGSNRYYLQAGKIDRISSRMHDVTIYDVSNPAVGRTIYADSGVIAMNRGKTDLVLTLFDGQMREVKFHEPQSFQYVGFERQVMRMAGVQQGLDRSEETTYRTDRDMTTTMMRSRIDSLRVELGKVRAAANTPLPPSTGISDPATRDARARSLETEIRQFQVEVSKKYSIAAATLVFVLIGVPLALRFPRGGIGMVIAVSLTIFALYYVGLIGGETLGDGGYVSPTGAMWLMNGLFSVLGIVGLSRLGREMGSGRGSGWDDLAARLRFRRPRVARPVRREEGAEA